MSEKGDSMPHILVGVDESEQAGTVVRWAARLAATEEAEVILVSAWLAPTDVSPTEERARALDERRLRLDALWSRSARGAGIEVRSEVFDGDPREVLLEVAEGEEVDLLVVGRSRDGGETPGFLHLGSVAEYLAHHTTCPLAVVPPDAPTRPPRRTVVGVDGSTASATAVAWCAEHAAASGSEVVGVNVQSPFAARSRDGSPDDWLHYVAAQEVTTWLEPVERGGGATIPVAVRATRPADGLLDAAREYDADLVVVGTRGLGGFSGLRLGGTALRTLHRAHLPLVLVPMD
jgi:nucleotide-binding universal stress UspA family protein